MKSIYGRRGDLLAVIGNINDIKEGRQFFTAPEDFVQVGGFRYGKGTDMRSRKHLRRPGPPDRITQECVICFKGSMEAWIYNDINDLVDKITIKTGDFIILLSGGHGFIVKEDDTVLLEVKNGPFTSVEDNKEFT